MLGVKCDNRESVHGPMKVVLTPNIGLDNREVENNPNPLRRDLLEKSSEDEL